MDPRHSRRLRAGFAVTLGATAALATALPAYADYVDNDLRVEMPAHSVAAGSAGKPMTVDVVKSGSDAATNVVVTIDASGVDPAKAAVTFAGHAGCTVANLVETCHVDSYAKPGTDSYGLVVTPTAAATPGNAGPVVASVTSDTTDEYTGDNSGSFPVTVTDPGVDLVALAEPVASPIEPGHSRPLALALANAGSTTVHGVSFTVDTRWSWASLAERYQECTTTGTATTCVLPDVDLGPDRVLAFVDDKGDSLLHLAADPHALGLAEEKGTFEVSPATGAAARSARGGRSLAARLAAPTRRVTPHTADRDPGDNTTTFAYRIADNPADVQVTVPSYRARVGDVVTVRATVTNAGPGDGRGFTVYADKPSGTTLVGTPTLAVGDHSEPYMCDPQGGTDGHDVRCFHDGEFLPTGTKGAVSGVLTFQLKVTSADLGTGRVTANDGAHDPDPKNNTAPVRIALESGSASPSASPTAAGGSGGGSGSLPVTGTRLGLIGGAGAALLVAGAAVLVLARRRARA